jgi:acylphosphatase
MRDPNHGSVVGAFQFQTAMTTAKRFLVSGRVQGVGYRYFACRAAETCGVAGTVRNLPDGTVEAVAEGEPAAVAAFRADLERGPRYGHVDRVVEEPAAVAGHSDFRVVY